MSIDYERAAQRGLRAMPRQDARRLMTKIETYANDPDGQHGWARTLTRRSGVRIRQGQWRAIVTLEAETLIVLTVAHRRDVYD